MDFSEIGLESGDRDVYVAVLRTPGLTRAELAASVSESSRTRIGRALESLVSKGLITTPAGRPLRYVPIPPDVGIEMLARRQIEAARTAQQLVPDLMEMYWRSRHESPSVDFVEIVRGPLESLQRRVRQLHDTAQDVVRGFERPPFPWQSAKPPLDELVTHIEPDADVERESLSRNVTHRVVYEQSQVDDPNRWRADLTGLIDAGEEARVMPSLPLKLILFDDWAATTPLVTPNGDYLASVIVHKSPLLDALSALFEAYWERAVPLTLLTSSPREDPVGEQLVTLLAAGLTDGAIARHLGVSRSTVQRRVNQLMEATRSRTRFQLGLQLMRQGDTSLPPPHRPS